MKALASLLVIAVLLACEAPTNSNQVGTFYNVDSLINSQIELLTQDNAQITKSYTQAEQTESTVLPEVDWKQELEILKAMDINKPSLRTAYQTVDSVQDSLSNLTILSYQLIEESALPVKMLNIYYLRHLSDIKKITATTNLENALYSSSKDFELLLDQKNGATALDNYSISIKQSRWSGESFETRFKGVIN